MDIRAFKKHIALKKDSFTKQAERLERQQKEELAQERYEILMRLDDVLYIESYVRIGPPMSDESIILVFWTEAGSVNIVGKWSGSKPEAVRFDGVHEIEGVFEKLLHINVNDIGEYACRLKALVGDTYKITMGAHGVTKIKKAKS